MYSQFALEVGIMQEKSLAERTITVVEKAKSGETTIRRKERINTDDAERQNLHDL